MLALNVSALKNGAQLVMHVNVRLCTGLERLIFDHAEARNEPVVGSGVI
jgi:hypothetical protein